MPSQDVAAHLPVHPCPQVLLSHTDPHPDLQPLAKQFTPQEAVQEVHWLLQTDDKHVELQSAHALRGPPKLPLGD